jgi:hypothetical protein
MWQAYDSQRVPYPSVGVDSALLNKPRNDHELQKTIRDISNDFRTLLADAQVRGMERR